MPDPVTTRTARETFDRAVSLLLEHDMAGFAALWAPDGTIDFPFAVPPQPRQVKGRDGIADYLAQYIQMVDVREAQVHVIHQTEDPATIIVEWQTSGVFVATGAPYTMPYVAVITVAANGITGYRDYWTLAMVDHR